MVDSDQWDTMQGRRPYVGHIKPVGAIDEPIKAPDFYQKQGRPTNRQGVMSYAALIRFEESQTRSWFTRRHG